MQNSKAYDCLIKQLNANGSEKMDGYYPEVMEGIYDWEREEVEDIIWDAFFNKKEIELAQFFPKLKKYDGIKALKESTYLLQIPSEASVEIGKILYEATGDEEYLDIIKKNIDASPETISFVSILSYCKPCQRLYNILVDIYINNSNKVNRSTAVMGILYNKGIIKDRSSIKESNDVISLRKKFKSEDSIEREKILEKFEAVCAMLQPEKLRLSPDKYREKLEGINTGYQNAKDTHEQEQSDYEAELYEIETVWYKKMLDKAEDYLIRSAECVVLGNFTDEVTVLGVGVQIVLGIFDLDLPCDIRDIIADVRNLAQADEIKWDMIAMLALDLIGVIPVIGALKYSDEIGTLFKNADKVSVVARSTDGAGVLAKHADEAGAWLHGGKVFRYSDETAEAVASGEKLLKESGTIYESFADMMSPEDAKRYLDFLENGSREGLTSAELAGVEKADALLVSRKVEYEDVWDLRNVGDLLESGSKGGTLAKGLIGHDFEDYLSKIIGGES